MAGSNEELKVILSLDDSKFTQGIKSAQQSTRSLAQFAKSTSQGIDSVGSSLNGIGSKADKATSGIKKVKEATDKLKNTNTTIKVGLRDKATPHVAKIQTELKALHGKAYTAVVNVRQNMAGGLGGIGQKISGAALGVPLQMAAGAGIAFGIYDAIKTFKSFEAQMSTVKAIAGPTGDEFEQLKQKAMDMGAKTKFTATEAGKAFEYMGMAGWKTEEMLGGIEGVMNLAAASGEDLGLVSDIVTDSMTAFGMQASQAGHFADVLAAAATNSNTDVGKMGYTFKYVAPLAGALGYSVEDVGVAVGMMADAGIKAEQAGTSLRAVFTRMAKPTKQSAQAMNELGLSLTDSTGKIKPFNEMMGEMREKFKGLSQDRKIALAGMLAGTEGMSGLLAIVNGSDQKFDQLTDALNNADGAAKKMAETKLDNLDGELTLLSSNWESLMLTIMKDPGGGIRDVVHGINSVLTDFSDSVKEHGMGIRAVFDGITSAIKSLVAEARELNGVKSVFAGVILGAGALGLFKGAKRLGRLFKGKTGPPAEVGGGDSVGEMTVNAAVVYLTSGNPLNGMPGKGSRGKGSNAKSSKGIPNEPPSIKKVPEAQKLGGFAKLGKYAKIFGKIAAPLAVAGGIYDIATAGEGNYGKAATRVGAGFAGAAAGGKAGAAIGGAVGSAVGGVGAVPGAAIGGLIGGIGGFLLGDSFGEDLANAINFDGIKAEADNTWEWIKNGMNGVINFAVGLGATILDIVCPGWEEGLAQIQNNWENLKSSVGSVLSEIASSASDVASSIVGFFSGAVDGIMSAFSGLVGWFSSNVWEPLKAHASDALSFISSCISSAVTSISGIQGRGQSITGLPHNATGDVHFGGGWTEINERGGEIVDLPNGSRIYPHATTERMLTNAIGDNAGATSLTVTGNTFIVREEADIDKIAHCLYSLFNQAESNYGGI